MRGAGWQGHDELARTLGDQTGPRGGVVGLEAPGDCPQPHSTAAGRGMELGWGPPREQQPETIAAGECRGARAWGLVGWWAQL